MSNSSSLNFPNLLTSLRLLLSIVLFIVIGIAQLDSTAAQTESQLYWAALIIFVVAASTDWVDGFWARRYGQVTVLGRIFDPFVDKVIICGTFIFLVASPGSKIAAWMAVVVTGREMLVTVLRSFFEQQGTDFSAKMAGKLKNGSAVPSRRCESLSTHLYGTQATYLANADCPRDSLGGNPVNALFGQ